MHFTDRGYIINMRRHGERSLILTVLTKEHGKVTGYVKNALSKKTLSTFQLGNLIELDAYSRVDDNMLTFRAELQTPYAVYFINNPDKLRVLSCFCSLCNSCMPELQNLEIFYSCIDDFFNSIDEDGWLAYYSCFEFYLLEYLGVGLDLSECAATGSHENLAYVSPKSGKAVCAEAGAPYRHLLYKYPHFIFAKNYHPDTDELIDLLKMTEFFLRKNFFNAHNLKFPQSRGNLDEILK